MLLCWWWRICWSGCWLIAKIIMPEEYHRTFRFCIKKPTIKVGKRNDLYSLRETLHFSLSLLA
ncbi:hypothetical protein HMPREF9545_00661 [Escherichia coli MS 16-3]|nr:hypothetical protein HMPREF9545_00661 [Escherichia coli MS 16-3]